MPITGASRVVQALKEGGVRCVFGLPGTQTVELFEALRRNGVRTVVTTNELSAAFMAGGWARVTGEPGVILTIQGPGLTWALTGVAEARLDSVPLVHIAGVADGPRARRFRQQGIAQGAIVAPLVKGVVDADSHADPGAAMTEALVLARSGEPGPVMVEISSATLSRETDAPALQRLPAQNRDRTSLDGLCTRVQNARRPVFMVGQGTTRYADRLRTLIEQIHSPLLTSPAARGVVPEDHPLNFGFDPLAVGVANVNALIESSDLVVVLGCKLAHTSTGGFALKLPPDRLIHVDTSDDVLGANYPASLQIVADAGEALDALLRCRPARSAWTSEEITTWRSRLTHRIAAPHEPRVAGTSAGDPQSFFASLRKALPTDAILALDSGLHQIMARRYYTVLAPLGLILPTDFQSMGFGISTAIGARLANPHRAVVALVGDGGFAMTGLELLTAIRERITLIVIVFVDGSLGQIRMQQLEAYGASHAVSLENPDFSLFAAAVGARHLLVGDDDLEEVVATALENSGVTIVEVPVGDTFRIRRMAAFARARETTRRVASPHAFRLFRDVLKRVSRIVGLAPLLMLGSF